LLGIEAIVLVTKYFADLIKQALGLGKIVGRVHEIKTMYKNRVSIPGSKMPSGLAGICETNCSQPLQFIWSDKQGAQNIRRSTSP